VSRGLAAVTGATGFLGQHLVRALAEEGWRVRILARRPPLSPFWAGLEPEVTPGDLGDEAALQRLCEGADVVVHNAGLISGDQAQLDRINVEGARRAALAARRASPQARFILVSSLSAREPDLSADAASKRAGEAAALDVLEGRLTIVRPPAIYGPGDRETLRFFQIAERAPVLPMLHPEAKVALIHVQDAARQIVAFADSNPECGVYALADGRPEGYTWRELMQTLAGVAGKPRLMLHVPPKALFLLAAASMISEGWRRGTATLTFGKVRELTHRDWGIRPDERATGAPKAHFDLRAGFAHTFDWYRKNGWL
jgi:nucleoside-diphosphate-sugar epimerase